MKKILIIVLCAFCLCSCSSSKRDEKYKETVKQATEPANEETSNTQGESKEDVVFDEVVGNWYFWTSESHFANMGINSQSPTSITFNTDSSFEYNLVVWNDSVTESKTQLIQGTYSISENKISMIYNQTYKTGFNNEKTIEDKINIAFCLIGNKIIIEGFGIYIKEGDISNQLPDCSNEYSKKLEGYYICSYIYGEGNDYFYFNEKGQINRIVYFNNEQKCEYDYVYNNFTSNAIEGMEERCGGDSECGFQSTYTINDDGTIDLFNDYGEQYGALSKISKEEFEEVKKDTTYYIGDIYLIKADVLNVREQPSTSSKIVSTLKKGDIRHTSYERKMNPVQADGYTWYFIDENKWIADKNGEWVQKIR